MPPAPSAILTYTPLDVEKSEIRLLTLKGASFDSPIQCSLEHVDLVNDPNYEALSYVWGNENNTALIEVNGTAVQVTVNLEAAMRHLRHTDKPRALWVDALCINQTDNAEKSQQVLRMTDIYRLARKVLVWLGKDDDDDQEADPYEGYKNGRASAQSAFTFVAWTSMFAAGHKNTPYEVDELFMDEDDRTAYIRVVALVQRKWFERMWVMQELAVAREAEVVCGNASIPWDYLRQVPDVFQKATNINDMTAYLYVTPFQDLRKIELCRLERMLFDATDAEYRSQLGYSLSPLTGALFHLVGDRKMKDIRDRLYAILGLYGDNETWALEPRLAPDYEKSAAEVFTGLARYLIEDHRHLDILCAHHDDGIESIPSWVPTWGKPGKGTHLSEYISTKAPTERRTGTSFDPVFSPDGATLKVKGRLICWIEHICTPWSEPEPSSDTLDGWSAYVKPLLRGWKEEITSSSLLQRQYREASWKNDIARDFRTVITHGMNDQTEFMNYDLLMNDALLDDILHHMAKDAIDNDDREYQAKLLRLDMDRWANRLYHRVGSEVPFVTRKGIMGLTANSCRPQFGDIVCIIYGASVPFILRESSGVYQFVGPCYLESWMDTKSLQEIMEVFAARESSLTEFTLK